MMQLRSGTIGTARAGCQVLEMTRTIGGLKEIGAELEDLAEKVYTGDGYWGGENNAVVVMVDEQAEPWAAALAMVTIAKRDEVPVATLLIAQENDDHAMCVYAGESAMEIGERIVYEAGEPEAPATEAAPANTADAATHAV